ncbi:MAG TPA: FAD:protein FMN transferase [Candidatus Limnocylindrales bacterium]
MDATAAVPEVRAAAWSALGTGVRIVVHGTALDAARGVVEELLDRVDRTYSRFRPDSELVALNARAGETVAASPLLLDAIEIALWAARDTNGAVDPTVGRAMRAIGYDIDFRQLPADAGSLEIRLEPIPGWQSVELSRTRGTVRLAPGVELDLGSTGKAWAADLAAAAVAADARARRGGASRAGRASADDRPVGVLVSLGGDIATTGTPPDGGWRILIAEDSETPLDALGETVAIAGGAIATSSTTVRRWRRGETAIHHLVDPRTGAPASSPWRTVTVAAPSCVLANTVATDAITGGSAGFERLLASGRPARLVATEGTIHRLNGWPDPAAVVEPLA